MWANEYQLKALRTAADYTSYEMLINGALGIAGEGGEVADLIKKHLFQGHTLNEEKAIEELGDLCWYIAITAAALEIDLNTILEQNIAKLMKRYPNGFSANNSINRKEYTK